MRKLLSLMITVCALFVVLKSGPVSLIQAATPTAVPADGDAGWTIPADYYGFKFSFQLDFFFTLEQMYDLPASEFAKDIREFKAETKISRPLEVRWKTEQHLNAGPGKELAAQTDYSPDIPTITLAETPLKFYSSIISQRKGYLAYFRSTVWHELFHVADDSEVLHDSGLLIRDKGDWEVAVFRHGATFQSQHVAYGELEESIVSYLAFLMADPATDLYQISYAKLFLTDYAHLSLEQLHQMWVQPHAIYDICARVFQVRYPQKQRCTTWDLYVWVVYTHQTQPTWVKFWGRDSQDPNILIEDFFRTYEQYVAGSFF